MGTHQARRLHPEKQIPRSPLFQRGRIQLPRWPFQSSYPDPRFGKGGQGDSLLTSNHCRSLPNSLWFVPTPRL